MNHFTLLQADFDSSPEVTEQTIHKLFIKPTSDFDQWYPLERVCYRELYLFRDLTTKGIWIKLVVVGHTVRLVVKYTESVEQPFAYKEVVYKSTLNQFSLSKWTEFVYVDLLIQRQIYKNDVYKNIQLRHDEICYSNEQNYVLFSLHSNEKLPLELLKFIHYKSKVGHFLSEDTFDSSDIAFMFVEEHPNRNLYTNGDSWKLLVESQDFYNKQIGEYYRSLIIKFYERFRF